MDSPPDGLSIHVGGVVKNLDLWQINRYSPLDCYPDGEGDEEGEDSPLAFLVRESGNDGETLELDLAENNPFPLSEWKSPGEEYAIWIYRNEMATHLRHLARIPIGGASKQLKNPVRVFISRM